MVLDYLINTIRLIDSFIWENKLIICSLLLISLLVCEIFNYYSIKKNKNIILKKGNLSLKEIYNERIKYNRKFSLLF